MARLIATIMAFLQRLFLLSLAPLLAFFALREYSPETLQTFETALRSYVADTPLSQYLSDPLLPPSELPLLFSSVPQQSHVEKIAPIAVALAELGHPVTFICGRVFENYVSSLHPNIAFQPFEGNDDKFSEEDMKYWMSLPSGIEKEIWATNKVIVDGAPDAHNTYQAYFKNFRDRYGDTKPLISLYDCTVIGHQTVHLGVPGIKPDASIGISLLPLLLHSNETFPSRLGRKPHQGPDAQEVHQKAYESIKTENPYEWEVSQAWWAKLKEMGSPRDDFPQVLDGMNVNSDYLVTMGIPEFEFPRKNVGIDLRYFGALKKPQEQQSESSDLPSWWNDVIQAKAEGKKIVVVSQGTVETKPEELILPTLEALKDREDVFVVATFYTSEPEEVPGLVVPENARVAKYVPHNALLPLVRCCSTSISKLLTLFRLTSWSQTEAMEPFRNA